MPKPIVAKAGSVFNLDNSEQRNILSGGIDLKLCPFTQDTDAILAPPVLDIWGTIDCISYTASNGKALFTSPGDLEYPLRLRFLIVAANKCMVDNRNIIAGVTAALLSANDLSKRSGEILRISGLRGSRILMYAYRLVDDLSAEKEEIMLTVSAEGDTRGTHRTQVEVGNYCS